MNAPVFSKKMPKQDFDLLDMMAPLVGVKAEKRITKNTFFLNITGGRHHFCRHRLCKSPQTNGPHNIAIPQFILVDLLLHH
jgi:hypothetical protein